MSKKNEPTVKHPRSLSELLAELEGAGGNKGLSAKAKQEVQDYIKEILTSAVRKEVESEAVKIKQSLQQNTQKFSDRSFDGLKEKIEKDRMNAIQATSIVTIFIGFLVVQFNILQGNYPAKDMAGLTLLLLSSIIIFTLLLDLVIKLDLPFKKTRTTKGLTGSSITDLARVFGGYSEEVNLSWKPNSWGEGLIIRSIFMLAALFIGGIGVSLLL